MTNLKDNLKRWRDSAEIDWFSHFIKAWIPFNAWMTDTYGDLSDRELLDKVKAGSNVVYNRIVPILSPGLPHSKDSVVGWQDDSSEAQEFRLKVEELHRLLQSCLIQGRRGQVSFEKVDLGYNPIKDQQITFHGRVVRVRRDHPVSPQVTLEVSASKTQAAFSLTLESHRRNTLEDDLFFKSLKVEYRTKLLGLFESIAPRKMDTVLARHDVDDVLRFGNTKFVQNPDKVFSALVDIIYSLRNALFHGSITPNTQHNEIYEPAYHIVMRLVRCTV
jgi:hypothetical protein